MTPGMFRDWREAARVIGGWVAIVAVPVVGWRIWRMI
jgi:hypothetical protein